MTIRKLASIAEITYIKPIEGADAIECAIVNGGWPVVVKKGEYQVGDVAIYLEIDSWVPHELAPFLSKGQEPREYNGVKGERLRTVKLRGQISQGLLLPVTAQFIISKLGAGPGAKFTDYIGRDVTEVLGIQKWEPPIPAQLAGTMKGNFPHFIPKTDQERCQNLRKEIFEEHKGETYEVTTKLDGSSMTVYVKDGEIGVCSRNIDLKETEGNSFWKAAREQGIIDAMLEISKDKGEEYAIQGELIGEGIQGNPEKLKGQRFYLFDIYSITEGRYLKPQERYSIMDKMNLNYGADVEHVPFIDTVCGVTNEFSTIDDLLAFAEGPSLNPGTKREGLVFKSYDSDFTFKAIANSYLLKHKDR
ncbi:RNA ligase [Synechococcus phage S-CREM1]|nr:RNA ligase [Synechococcus phage S-CREM1]